MLIETFKKCFNSICLHSFAVVSHLGTLQTLIIKLLEELSGRISIDVKFYLNVSKKQQYVFFFLVLGH